MTIKTKVASLFGAAITGITSLAAAEQPTNFIIVLVDDMGWGDVGYQGANDFLTPNIDQLAADGVQFSQGYVTSSVCGPSRCGLITGRYQDRFGVCGNWGAFSKDGFPVDQPMASDLFKQAGYKTGVIGKWHFGFADEKYRPENRSWDYFYGFYVGGHDFYRADHPYTSKKKDFWPIMRNTEEVDYKTGDYLTEKFTEEAVSFIDRNKDEPFFLYVAYNAVHFPWQVPDSYLERIDAERDIDLKYRRILAGMVLAVDDGVGAINQALARNGIADNTAVIFLADNGSPAGVGGWDKSNLGEYKMSSKGPFKGFKGDTYEGGIRVPFAMKWPGQIKPGTKYEEPVISIDLVPTMMKHIGVATPETGFDGKNILPYIQGKKEGKPHETLYFRYMNDYAIRHGDWKLTWNSKEVEERNGDRKKIPSKDVRSRLFNLAEDIGEQNDLSEQFPEKKKMLQKMFDDWDGEMPQDVGLFPKPFTRK